MESATDVGIIGAGPAGTIAAALLKNLGHNVEIIEQSTFPRFSIGESLLPQCMEFIEQAGMSEAINAAGFQYKNGAKFSCNLETTTYDFRKKFSSGASTTFQVQRAEFDHLLAREAEDMGVPIHFGQKVTAFSNDGRSPVIHYSDQDGNTKSLSARYILDASGFGRVLPRLLDLETPSQFPARQSQFTHIEDNINVDGYDREKILIVIHPENHEIWYWLIPFSNGRASVGIVAPDGHLDKNKLSAEQFRSLLFESPEMRHLLTNAKTDCRINHLSGYACNVKALWGDGYALLGNAGEFLDPIFSSGVTIAMKSASLIAPLVDRHLKGETVDWENEYAQPLKKGVDTFRTYVNAWYDGSLQQVLFYNKQSDNIRSMIVSILAGYVWDESNPFVKDSERRLKSLISLCNQT